MKDVVLNELDHSRDGSSRCPEGRAWLTNHFSAHRQGRLLFTILTVFALLPRGAHGLFGQVTEFGTLNGKVTDSIGRVISAPKSPL